MTCVRISRRGIWGGERNRGGRNTTHRVAEEEDAHRGMGGEGPGGEWNRVRGIWNMESWGIYPRMGEYKEYTNP